MRMGRDTTADGVAGGPARHVPVLVEEVMRFLAPAAGGTFIDGTFGAGGYTRAILAAGASVIAIDRDPSAIAAGKTLAELGKGLSADTAIVRAMPNTPAAIGQGITALVANAAVSRAQRTLCGELLAAVGAVVWLEDEGHMDAVTAISGSGPAYVFLLIECLEQAAVELGLGAALARQLALATVAGSGAYAAHSREAPAELRRRVTSPKGTTQAALDVLMAEPGLRELLVRATRAAAERSRELAKV